ncbi:MAG: AtpZ/AtpI family protein [Magnetococcales bacterium]|nr:AtpZ/AtpI family protein [Magnetococcales bacterium]
MTGMNANPLEPAPGGPPSPKPVAPHGLGMAMRMSTELVSAVFVGGGIGYLLDYWLGSGPWLTLVFFSFGLAAGFRDMYCLAMQNTPGREGVKGDGSPLRRPKEPR